MPSREWQLRIQDILDSISGINERTQKMTFGAFIENQTIVKSVLYDLIIIGEASRNVPQEIKSRYPHIPWGFMAGMRNIAAHEYFKVDLGRVWATIEEDLPLLIPQLQQLLDNENSTKN